MKFKRVTHYCAEDTEFEADYVAMELIDDEGSVVLSLSDYYHDKSDIKIDGFLTGVSWATGEDVEVEDVDVADYEC